MAPVVDQFEALGTPCALAVADPAAAAMARGIVDAEIAACDVACSRFRDDSDLSRLNAGAGRSVPVSERLLDDLAVAMRAARLTDGIVDPTVGRALVSLGYDRDFGDLRSDPLATLTFVAVPGWQAVQVDRARRRARLPAGVLVDLGATAKARAADRAAATAARQTGCGVLVSLGGDVAFAGSVPAGGWRVRVSDAAADPVDGPGRMDGPGQTVALTTGALATSSVTVRTWPRGGTMVHHLIDPRTGGPAPIVWRTVSVVAATCVDANIASTAAVILGVGAPAWLATQGLCARLVAADGTVHLVGGWPDDTPLDRQLSTAGARP
jgi:thiamine biosynthesis lipoprotein